LFFYPRQTTTTVVAETSRVRISVA
jgi:hypothetical protein